VTTTPRTALACREDRYEHILDLDRDVYRASHITLENQLPAPTAH
jgi:hypothetical protein